MNPTTKPHTSNHTDVGTFFYPVDYLIAAFPKKECAQQVQQELIQGGYDIADCVLHTGKEIAEKSQLDLDNNSGLLDRLSWSFNAVKIHLEAAEQGATFLFIYAPEDSDVEHAMNVIRRVPFGFVHRYHSLAIEEIE